MKVALAIYSIRRRFGDKDNPLKLIDCPKVVKEEFGIDAIELYNRFLASKDESYLKEVVQAADEAGVELIGMSVDVPGNLSAVNEEQRKEAVENNREYIPVAKALGLPQFRVNTGGGSPVTEEVIQACIRSLRELTEEAGKDNIKIVLENHGGLSGDPDIMVRLIKEVSPELLGSQPDFGNFPEEIRYEGIRKITPYAPLVHAKMYEFDEQGEETRLDIKRIIGILEDIGFDAYLAIEFEGPGSDHEGVLKSKALLEKYL